MTNEQRDLIERSQKTRDTLLTIRTVMWTIAGVIIFGIMAGCLIQSAYYSGGTH